MKSGITNPIVAFLPCRAGSERIPLKNTRIFAGKSDGLLGIKLTQLSECSAIDKIVVSSNDPLVIAIAERFIKNFPKIVIDRRPEHLCTSLTSTDDLITYASGLIDDESLLWTHVTSPLVTAREYHQMIDSYKKSIIDNSHDSLMAVTPLRNFLWNNYKPVNYDRKVEKWPRTQTLVPLYMINSSAFIISGDLMRKFNDRIGASPKLYELDEISSFEVDWEDQFKIAEMLFLNSIAKNSDTEIK